MRVDRGWCGDPTSNERLQGGWDLGGNKWTKEEDLFFLWSIVNGFESTLDFNLLMAAGTQWDHKSTS
jgi:hypothetical protein